MKHTPGPWKVAGPIGKGIWITDETCNNQIAVVYGENQTPEAEANARLIAAAPELLAACQHAKSELALAALDITANLSASESELEIIQRKLQNIAMEMVLVVAKAEGRV
jgi:hypothetical protein